MASTILVEPQEIRAATYTVKAYGAMAPDSQLSEMTISRREPGPTDVQIDVLYCGICHTDLHFARNDWAATNPTTYPCVPGHEIVGHVTKAGSKVTKFEEGDTAGVGCMVDSCRACASCREGEEQYCDSIPTFTYNSPDKYLGGMTYGGYSTSLVVDEAFALRVPPHLNLAAAAPVLCAGITTYAPLRRANVRRGQKVGVLGLGGLGHMAVKIANAMGANVVVFTTSENKLADAIGLGAREAVLSKHEAELRKQFGTFDFILDTVPVGRNLNVGLELLKRDGTLALVGVPAGDHSFGAFGLAYRRRSITASLIGGIRETQEMLDFCGEHGLTADIELIRTDQINEAYERLLAGDVKYRFVIDMASLK
jgi:alcohol dehydrogenase (NADP+)